MFMLLQWEKLQTNEILIKDREMHGLTNSTWESFVNLFQVIKVGKVYYKKYDKFLKTTLNLACEFMDISGRPARSPIEMVLIWPV